ncbi:hypothetical protein JX265_007001 [Neoarthrinium moseri]|uniref:Uncharacterized protein n=1 Tax=Neoarthrinium moseri TaxID=1658444 RepID=A0A9P9WKA7_9PEZI|nr:uncharacterized protein JN550_007951 [Neoarthrinium moseri]KAI1844740.1 hypothetical protein JX266_009196 [Neoarthrinium moseri]KAI1865973.1 hypothetical protein JN550_007951 [Neoarthrinium moseri]KAI1868178.1 hypothetical protein JX265_007001 [Neoarthrinium moseri]
MPGIPCPARRPGPRGAVWVARRRRRMQTQPLALDREIATWDSPIRTQIDADIAGSQGQRQPDLEDPSQQSPRPWTAGTTGQGLVSREA